MAIKQYAQTENKKERARLLVLAQQCINEAVELDDRAMPDPWDGDSNH